MPPTIATDITGRTFGKLTVIERAPMASKRAFWLCRCACGETTVKMGKYLLCGDTNSCGCDQKAMRARGNVKHGGFLHGTRQREYTIWRSMKSRCYTKSSSNYRFYGGRGVSVCDRWRDDFGAFQTDMGPCPEGYTIDRIETAGHYAPDNCRWATWETQLNNTTRNVFGVLDGRRLTLSQIARAANVKYDTLHDLVRDRCQSIDAAIQHLRQLSATR